MLDFKGGWDDHLPFIVFAYNNSYHSSIEITLFEALHDRSVDHWGNDLRLEKFH